MDLRRKRVVKSVVILGVLLVCATAAVVFSMWLRPPPPLGATEVYERPREREKNEATAEQERRTMAEIAERLQAELAAQEARRKLQLDGDKTRRP